MNIYIKKKKTTLVIDDVNESSSYIVQTSRFTFIFQTINRFECPEYDRHNDRNTIVVMRWK